MLQRVRQKNELETQAVTKEFYDFLRSSSAPANLTPEQREQLVRDFLRRAARPETVRGVEDQSAS
jgi:hypothetical protein